MQLRLPKGMKSLLRTLLVNDSQDSDNLGIGDLLKQRKENKTNGGVKKVVSKKKWRQIARDAFKTKKKSSQESDDDSNSTTLQEKLFENLEPEDLTLLQLLALNALELTAPASNILLKNRSNNWVQLSGHEGSFSIAGPGTIWKKRSSDDDNEVIAYQHLMTDIMKDMVPKFYRDVYYNGENFIEIQDLLETFKNPSIMDIKMGTRTFLESEVDNNKARADLYEKMIKVDSLAPSEEETKNKTITKLRYMQFRENLSSSSTLGFRIEGFKIPNQEPNQDLKFVKEPEEVSETLRLFFGSTMSTLSSQFLEKLQLLRSTFEKSNFFQSREVIGSSLLFIHDETKIGVWMIDFAKTVSLPASVKSVDHRSPWQLGNHEDGFLFGLDNLIQILENCSNTS